MQTGSTVRFVATQVAWCVPVVAVAAVVLAFWSSIDGQNDLRMSRADSKPESVVDAHGSLHVPSRYRADYEFLGTWAIAAANGAGSSELHNVYASPGAIAGYHTGRHFADGTVLVKEVYETSTAPMTTGTVSHARTLKGWFVMVKDNNSHPGNSLWGDGWAWSWFDAGDPTKTTSTAYKRDVVAVGTDSCRVIAPEGDETEAWGQVWVNERG